MSHREPCLNIDLEDPENTTIIKPKLIDHHETLQLSKCNTKINSSIVIKAYQGLH